MPVQNVSYKQEDKYKYIYDELQDQTIFQFCIDKVTRYESESIKYDKYIIMTFD
jgi:hypothetical protein